MVLWGMGYEVEDWLVLLSGCADFSVQEFLIGY